MNKLIIAATVVAGLSVSASADSVTYVAGENGVATTPLSNGKYLKLSQGNSITITDTDCGNIIGYTITVSNPKFAKSATYNSCGNGSKISWVDSSSESTETTEWSLPEGHVTGTQLFVMNNGNGENSEVMIEVDGSLYTAVLPDSATELNVAEPAITDDNNKFSFDPVEGVIYYDNEPL